MFEDFGLQLSSISLVAMSLWLLYATRMLVVLQVVTPVVLMFATESRAWLWRLWALSCRLMIVLSSILLVIYFFGALVPLRKLQQSLDTEATLLFWS